MYEFRLRLVVDSVIAERGVEGWSLTEDKVWCRVVAPDSGAVDRLQGWKLHVSATRYSAPEVLHRVAGILIDRGCSFKFAKSIQVVEEMTGERYDRAQCGKIITVYPWDDDQFRELAVALDDATAGMPGPAILSDRPLGPGSLVHYRYGAFQGVPVLTDDGVFQLRVADQDGTTFEDLRKPWFCPPAWAELPFPGPPSKAGAQPAAPRPVLIADRFEVREAIRHSARGGVYRAVDRESGAEVIVKQARAHVGTRLNGEDTRDGLRKEAANLSALSGMAPELIDLFDKDGHTFLVESKVPGLTLAHWMERELGEDGNLSGLEPSRALVLARQLADLLAEAHERGLVFQDFTPLNIMVTPDEELKLIDPELAAVPGTWCVRGHTPGFAALEVVTNPGQGLAPQQTVDLYSLGTVLYFIAVGTAPRFGQDEPRPLSVHGRLAAMLTAAGVHSASARLLAPAVLGLTADDPEARWPLKRLRAFLNDSVEFATKSVPAVPRRGVDETGGFLDSLDRLRPADQERLADDGLTHVLATIADPDENTRRLWPSTAFGDDTDPLNVQHGSAGVLRVLTQADLLLKREDLRATVARVAEWTDKRRHAVPRLLPGLYFGRSGTAWALYDAARHLGDADMEQHAVDLALAVPVDWPNPDVCHGVAGSALTQLHLWRKSGREEFLDRAVLAADALLAAAETDGGRMYWTIPASLDSLLAGITHLGFAHGVAGIGYALLATAQATGREQYLEAAVAAGDTLCAEAERGPWGARWRADRSDTPGTGAMQYHWCSGSSGVGTFLLRLWQATKNTEYLSLAKEAATAVRATKWFSGSAACHGLAGNGEFLLDLADAVGGPYYGWAEELAAALSLSHAVHGDLLLIPDESGRGVAVDYNTGLSGVISFLLRLRHGGPRLWMADSLSTDAIVGRHINPMVAPR